MYWITTGTKSKEFERIWNQLHESSSLQKKKKDDDNEIVLQDNKSATESTSKHKNYPNVSDQDILPPNVNMNVNVNVYKTNIHPRTNGYVP